MRTQLLIRIRILVVGIVIFACIIIVRLYILQVAHGQSYRAEANNQYVRSSRDIFDRGSIFFTLRNGERIAAASLKSGYMLALNPNQIEDAQHVYDTLRKHMDIDKELFFARAGKTEDPYEEMARHVTPEAAELIEKEDLKGVQLFREQWRYYPGGSMASLVLGFVGFGEDGITQKGQYGLERYWESVLERQTDRLYVNFFAEIFTNAREAFSSEETPRVGSVVTSIEPAVQQALDRVLLKTQDEWGAKQLAGIIMDPKTGAIYAMSALPSFDSNLYSEEKDARVFRNPFVEDVYEMGSIIKPIAMAIGLDEGAVTQDTTYNDTGNITVDGYKISNYDGGARGVVPMQEVLNQSLNLGMSFVADKVGGKVLGERMKAFGFGEETGIDIPFEARGLINNLDSPRRVEYATAAFGQGIALTPIATVRALAALGNGGYLVTPHFVTHIQYENGAEASVAPDDHVQVISEDTSREITQMLVNVVDDALRGGTVAKEHYAIAAKTGTAQMAHDGERGYYDDRYLHSFFGYFPAYEPRFIIFLYHLEPQGARYASETLTAPFMELVDFLINYYDIPPDR
ncbi:MAG: Penicillin-binding protein, transpeptidase domain protein [Parcubacteria group bacterium GW2011_GWA2_43_11]|nr:MAG: Penicillin-binding protein, transpeptidase domain protein [Parcubacteria group bacterium GW2011_GWC2_42_11]KKS86266.1 MAG: Penicillin-binding protein, transpeptidase domain protein [Parcubacteria group bacterium GW2011_GWA2_43_11]